MADTAATASGHIDTQYRTMTKIVTDYLRSAIISHRFAPGERLAQDDIAKELSVSRMPIREALRILESEGLVELKHHRSAVVVSLNPGEISEIFGIRALLEAGAAKQAAPRMDDATIARLRQIHGEMEKVIGNFDGDRWLALNSEFHGTIHGTCGWPRLRLLIEAQRNAILPYQRVAAYLLARASRAHQEHGLMLVAAEKRDGTALARLTANHLQATAQELISYLSTRSESGDEGGTAATR